MKRRLFTSCAAVSLLLYAAVCVLWARSYFVADGLSWSDGVRVPTAGYQIAWRKALLSRNGRIHFVMDRNMGGSAHRRRLTAQQARGAHELTHLAAPGAIPGTTDRRLLGFGYLTHAGYPMLASAMRGPPVELTRVWTVPLWAPAAAAALLPAWWLAARGRSRRRAIRGLCARCGYDLRASPDRCPECGTAGPAATPSP